LARSVVLSLPGHFRAAIFDLDGVILDSEPLWAQAEVDLFASHGVQFTPADAAVTHGLSIEDSVTVYASRLPGVDPDSLRVELLATMRDRYPDAPVRPGARALVRWLGGQMPIAVASNTDGDLVRIALAGAGLLDAFSAIVSAADVGSSKPNPDVYFAACRSLGVEPYDAVAFEDSPVGVRAAKAAGMTCIGVPDRDGVALVAAGADVVVDSLEDFAGVVWGANVDGVGEAS
jgi:HAD superfamily hydrolase (TIGR01509 family)